MDIYKYIYMYMISSNSKWLSLTLLSFYLSRYIYIYIHIYIYESWCTKCIQNTLFRLIVLPLRWQDTCSEAGQHQSGYIVIRWRQSLMVIVSRRSRVRSQAEYYQRIRNDISICPCNHLPVDWCYNDRASTGGCSVKILWLSSVSCHWCHTRIISAHYKTSKSVSCYKSVTVMI